MIIGKVWTGRFIARIHLELRTSEFLYLELMVILDFSQCTQVAFGSQIKFGSSQIGDLWHSKDKIKPAQGVNFHLPVAKCIALRISDLITDRTQRITHKTYITTLFSTNAPQPTFDVYFLTRAIHLAVIEYIPLQRITGQISSPHIFIPEMS